MSERGDHTMSDYQFHAIVGLIWLVILWVIPVVNDDRGDGSLGWGPVFGFILSIVMCVSHFLAAIGSVP